jgi:hypothetical protein
MKIISGIRRAITTGCLLGLVALPGCGNGLSPTITGFSPTSGDVGETVTIQGTNFDTTAADNTVTFNGVTATVDSSTATSIVTTVPSGATTGSIFVKVDGMTAASSNSFTVRPAITEFLPVNGSVGTAVIISGTGFDSTAANNVVTFNGAAAVVTAATSRTIVTSVPSAATTGKITLKVNGESVTSSSSFTVN